MRLHGAKQRPAVRAAILYYYHTQEHPLPDVMMEVKMRAVSKAVQRHESGKPHVHFMAVASAFGLCRNTPAGLVPLVTPAEIAQEAAQFLPPSRSRRRPATK